MKANLQPAELTCVLIMKVMIQLASRQSVCSHNVKLPPYGIRGLLVRLSSLLQTSYHLLNHCWTFRYVLLVLCRAGQGCC
jgi:hypothetical protein